MQDFYDDKKSFASKEVRAFSGKPSIFSQAFVQPSLVWASAAAFLSGSVEKHFQHYISFEVVAASFVFIFFISLVTYSKKN
ncbi:MAG: hypothetical protein WC817_04015 [Patescibacteria group bacterium]|jgi:hypothetical protein